MCRQGVSREWCDIALNSFSAIKSDTVASGRSQFGFYFVFYHMFIRKHNQKGKEKIKESLIKSVMQISEMIF